MKHDHEGISALTRMLVGQFDKLPEAFLAALGISALCVAVAAVRVTAATSRPTVTNAWISTVGPSAPAAAYFTLSNPSAKTRVMVGVSSPDCGALMMHQSRSVNKVDVMAVVAQRIVPAHGQIVFAPGGFHLMCQSPSKALRPGAHIPITLRFSDGRHLRAWFPVRPPMTHATG